MSDTWSCFRIQPHQLLKKVPILAGPTTNCRNCTFAKLLQYTQILKPQNKRLAVHVVTNEYSQMKVRTISQNQGYTNCHDVAPREKMHGRSQSLLCRCCMRLARGGVARPNHFIEGAVEPPLSLPYCLEIALARL